MVLIDNFKNFKKKIFWILTDSRYQKLNKQISRVNIGKMEEMRVDQTSRL